MIVSFHGHAVVKLKQMENHSSTLHNGKRLDGFKVDEVNPITSC